MASNIQITKELKDLNENEAMILLENIQCKTITNTLLSEEYGEITGEVLEELDDEILQSIGINISFQRKQFLKSITKYKSEGVSIDLLRSDETLKKQSLETDQTTVDNKHTLSIVESRTKLHKLLYQSEKILEASSDEMDIYAFPAKQIKEKSKVSQRPGTNLKKIIVIGETGSGKSTFIDAFINYAVGVQMDDNFRFKLVVDKDERANDQTITQTSEISGYLIEDTILDSPIQIWDTPGFGDTIERDEEIKQQINELLKIEDYYHIMCFVVRANIYQLTNTQRYIIDKLLLFFEKEAQENIYIITTFVDDSRPDVLHALEKCKNFPYDENRWFAFNNGSLFMPASKRTRFSKEYWSIVSFNMAKLFSKIGEIHPFSLSLTEEVRLQREYLDRQLNEIDFINLSRTRFLTLATSNKNTICKKCNSNCHIDCHEEMFCKIFNWKYICKICLCDFSNHHQVHYIYEVDKETRF